MKERATQTRTAQASREKSASNPKPAPTARVSVPLVLRLQRVIGNRAVQDFVQHPIIEPAAHALGTSVFIHGQQLWFDAQRRAGRERIQKEEMRPDHISVAPIHATLIETQLAAGPKPIASAEQASTPQTKKENEFLPAVDEGVSKEGVAAEVPVGKQIPGAPATPEKAAASPEEDPQYQVVVEEMEIKAKHQKTPAKKPKQKQDETVLAAKAATKDPTNTRYAKENHLAKLGLVQPVDLTVPQFMAELGVAVQKLEAKVPTNDSDEQRAVFERAQKTATQDVATQGKNHSQRLRDEADNDPSEYPDSKKEEAIDYKLKPDPAGNIPAIKQAKAAAPKSESEKAISLDDQSRELDGALQNHDVAGQKINIDESSLALPVSGEKSFDEAGEAKRQAQAEIARSKPRYREQESEVIGRSQNDIDSLVNVRGLRGHHGLRSEAKKATP